MTASVVRFDYFGKLEKLNNFHGMLNSAAKLPLSQKVKVFFAFFHHVRNGHQNSERK